MLFYAAACGLGLLAGAAFAWLWLWVVPRGTNRRFWTSMSALSREMLEVDETRAFLRLYRRLGALLAPYLARNLGGTALACLPMVALLLTLAPLVFEGWDAKAERVAFVPESAAKLLESTVPHVTQRTGYCSSFGYCALFAALDFRVVETDKLGVPYAVMRADHSDVNPLWPFLSDLEAAFFAAFMASTIGGLLWLRPS
jgi:hypothetical protein